MDERTAQRTTAIVLVHWQRRIAWSGVRCVCSKDWRSDLLGEGSYVPDMDAGVEVKLVIVVTA